MLRAQAVNGCSSIYRFAIALPSASDCCRSADNTAQAPWSDAIAHHTGHVDSTLLALASESSVPTLGCKTVWSTGMPVTHGGVPLIKKWMLRQIVLLHVIEDIAVAPAQ